MLSGFGSKRSPLIDSPFSLHVICSFLRLLLPAGEIRCFRASIIASCAHRGVLSHLEIYLFPPHLTFTDFRMWEPVTYHLLLQWTLSEVFLKTLWLIVRVNKNNQNVFEPLISIRYMQFTALYYSSHMVLWTFTFNFLHFCSCKSGLITLNCTL